MRYAAAAQPVGEVIGRQPYWILVTPSKAGSPWYGAIRGGVRTGFDGHSVTGGERFTEQQVETLISRGIDVLTAPAMLVRRKSTDAEIWSGLNTPRPLYEFDCPVLNTRADGTVNVITPSGAVKAVCADGWIRAPKPSRFRSYRS